MMSPHRRPVPHPRGVSVRPACGQSGRKSPGRDEAKSALGGQPEEQHAHTTGDSCRSGSMSSSSVPSVPGPAAARWSMRRRSPASGYRCWNALTSPAGKWTTGQPARFSSTEGTYPPIPGTPPMASRSSPGALLRTRRGETLLLRCAVPDLATSVLDVKRKAHEAGNLYVTETSIFPSIVAVNAALTTVGQRHQGRRAPCQPARLS